MNAIESLMHQPAAQAIGWALLQFVWHGALVASLTAAALALLRRSAADIRYVVATVGLALMATLPVVTALQAWDATAVTALHSKTAAPVLREAMPSAGVGTGVQSEPDATRAQPSSSPRVLTIGNATVIGITERVPQSHYTLRSDPTGHLTFILPNDLVDGVAQPVSGDTRTAAGSRPPGVLASASQNIAARKFESWLPMLLLVWLSGVGVLSLRLVSGWIWIERIRRHRTAAAAERWQQLAARLARRLHISRPVRVRESAGVDVPTVIGWMKPLVLLPASVLAGLSPPQLEAVLAHELAHIRRHDYLVNLLQTLVETLLFYHPAVWWLSNRIRAERENCCDDLAVSLCGDPLTYARALADLEELRGGRVHVVLAASGGSLLQRVRRLLGAPSHAEQGPGWLAGTAAMLLIAGIAAGAAGRSTVGVDRFPAVSGTDATSTQTPSPLRESSFDAVSPKRIAEDGGTRAAALVRGEGTKNAPPAEELRGSRARTGVIDRLNAPARVSPAEPQGARQLSVDDAPGAAAALASHSKTPAFAAATATASSFSATQSHGNFVWSDGNDRLAVNYSGEIEFTDDDADVKRMSPGGYLKIREDDRRGGRTIEFRADASGNIQRRFWVGASERPFEPEGRQWLAQALPRFIRQTGIGAPARVARILKTKGAPGVLAEISLIEGSWAKRVYFAELLKAGPLETGVIRSMLAQAGREIDSDFELASLLIDGADRLLVDHSTRQAYFDASRTIDSDFEMRRVYSSVLKRGAVSPDGLAGMLQASAAIDSDFEQASLLAEIAKLSALDHTSRAPFFKALATVGSDFEHRRVLSALARRSDLAPETITAMVESAGGIGSDFEKAAFLLDAIKAGVDGGARAPFFRAVQDIGSSFERGRVLQALAKRPGLSSETMVDLLRAVKGMSSFEAGQVLLAVAALQPLAGPARDLYIEAAGQLGDFEQGRVMTALVKNEQRR
jgi:beta-lactamase regulating signal transducer with metallopeptidase domain